MSQHETQLPTALAEPAGDPNRGRRRVTTVGTVAILLAVTLLLLPLAAPVLVIAGLVRRKRLALLRTYAFLIWMLGAELAGVSAAIGLWCAGRVIRPDATRYQAWHYNLQRAWTAAMWHGARISFSFQLKLEVAPEAERAIADGPVIVAPRHAGVADVLLPALCVANRYGVDLRYVLKRELLSDPCLDIVGQRLPNAFVGRGGSDSAKAVAAVRALGQELKRGQGVLIYPEGTRFTPEKRARVIASAEAREDTELANYARSLSSTLAPRPGGTLALLNAAPDAVLLVLEHTGFERATRLPDLASGALVGLELRARLRAVPRPATTEVSDLWRIWSDVDAWVAANTAATGQGE